uniref:Uncharacterized protein n=1 Tax=Toxoplasma gondii TgCATBr9 TaxID=943120 RepID=A0A2T6J0A7_TOXGO|nr:hypothetical protein TGBR9_381130 [Toxoplasma gondii TgCATBr9]
MGTLETETVDETDEAAEESSVVQEEEEIERQTRPSPSMSTQASLRAR